MTDKVLKCWCVVAVIVLLSSGCAVANRLGMPNTPTQGQSESQVQADKLACSKIAEDSGRPRPCVGCAITTLLTGIQFDDRARLENQAYKACMTGRGYKSESQITADKRACREISGISYDTCMTIRGYR